MGRRSVAGAGIWECVGRRFVLHTHVPDSIRSTLQQRKCVPCGLGSFAWGEMMMTWSYCLGWEVTLHTMLDSFMEPLHTKFLFERVGIMTTKRKRRRGR